MKLEPNGTRVLVKMKEVEYKGKLEIPDSAKDTQTLAEIVTVGKDCKVAKKGDLVHLPVYSKLEVIIDTVKYIVLKEEDILLFVRS